MLRCRTHRLVPLPSLARFILLLLPSPVAAFALPQQSTQPAPSSATSIAASAEKLEQARRRFDQSFYILALQSFDDAAHAFPLDSAIGRARCFLRLHEPLKALDALSVVAPQDAENVDVRLARADSLQALGRYDDALDDYRAALSRSPDSIPARSRLARLLEYLGHTADAAALLKPLASLDPANYPDDPAVRVDLALARLALLQLDPPDDVADAYSHVLNAILLPVAQGTHRSRWLARIAIADLLASKHNSFEARRDFQAALQLNPRLAEPHVGLALLDLERNDFDSAQERVTAALALAPRSPAVLRAAAAIRLASHDAPAASAILNQALEINPNDIESLALSASLHFAVHRPADAEKIIARASVINPHSPILHGVVGSWLAAQRQYADAERHLKHALEYAPHNPEIRCELAQLFLLLGRELEAAQNLRAARRADPYNERVVNFLNLLIDLESMARIDTEHFIIRYDHARDALIGPPAADWMEKCHVEVTAIFNFTPTQRTLVEIFPSRDAFAVRISGRPWIGTVGASTGPVIACCSPRKEAGSAYGWADCLRHEFVHTVTLAVTDNQISRWLTEGLAVYHESGSKPALGWNWSLLIADKFRTGEIFPLRTIDAGFMRPRTNDSVQQAYAQASLMVRFMLERFGPDVFLRILPQYSTLRDERLVFERVLHTSFDHFDREFESWLEMQLAQWGFPTARFPSKSELEQRIENNNRDADALALLARRTLLNRYLGPDARSPKPPGGGSGSSADLHNQDPIAQARRLANRALEINEKQPDALLVYALTPESPTDRESDDVREQRLNHFYHEIRPLVQLAPDEPQALLVVAQLALATARPETAAELCRKLTATVPQCTPAHQILADLYQTAGDSESAYPHLQQWACQDRDDPTPAIRIAEILLNQLESDSEPEPIVPPSRPAIDTIPHAASQPLPDAPAPAQPRADFRTTTQPSQASNDAPPHPADPTRLSQNAADPSQPPYPASQTPRTSQPHPAPSRDAPVIEWSQRVLRIDPFTLDHHKRLGRAYLAAKRWNDAIAPLRVVTDASPKDDAAWTALAEALFHAGRFADSAAAAEKAVALNADSRAQRILDVLNESP